MARTIMSILDALVIRAEIGPKVRQATPAERDLLRVADSILAYRSDEIKKSEAPEGPLPKSGA